MEKIKYEFGSFDKYGNLNGKYVVGMLFFIFFFTFFILLISKNIIELHTLNYKEIFKSLINEVKEIISLYKYSEFFKIINEYKVYFIIGLFFDFYYLYYVISRKKEQRKLANYGLENYYLKKKLKDGYIYEVVAGEIMDYDKFLKQFNNMTQRNKMGSCEIKRFDKVGVMVRFKNPTPSIEDLKDLKPQNFMKKDFLFLGFSGGFKEKRVPNYISFKELPHSFALLGTSGEENQTL